jgi:hypothetical protein
MSRVARLLGCALTGACLFAAVGCKNDLPRASNIDHMRVLGAVTEVEGDSARTTPRPGETAKLTWSMVYPDLTLDDSQLESLFFSCTAPTHFSGTPVCQELLDAAQGKNVMDLLDFIAGASAPDCAKNPDSSQESGPFSTTCVSGTPRASVKVAANFQAGAKLSEGIICRNGTPRFDAKNPTGLSCKPHSDVPLHDVESVVVYGMTAVEYSADTANHTPSMDAASFLFGYGNAPWLPTAASAGDTAELVADCSEAARKGEILSSNGQDELITIGYDASAREDYQGVPEALEFSSYVTAGELDHRFVLFDSEAELPLSAPLHWALSKEARDTLGDNNLLLRFYFTVIDHRGGFAATTRDLCVGRDLVSKQ